MSSAMANGNGLFFLRRKLLNFAFPFKSAQINFTWAWHTKIHSSFQKIVEFVNLKFRGMERDLGLTYRMGARSICTFLNGLQSIQSDISASMCGVTPCTLRG